MFVGETHAIRVDLTSEQGTPHHAKGLHGRQFAGAQGCSNCYGPVCGRDATHLEEPGLRLPLSKYRSATLILYPSQPDLRDWS